MKKIIIVLIFLALISPVFAQQDEERADRRKADPFYSINNTRNREENFYYVNVSVEKVYPVKEGYVVQYLCSASSTIATIGIPNEWLTNAAGRAEIVHIQVLGDWPTMTVFFVDGKFSHVRLYVHPAKSHLTWGNIPQGANVSQFFKDADSFNLEY